MDRSVTNRMGGKSFFDWFQGGEGSGNWADLYRVEIVSISLRISAVGHHGERNEAFHLPPFLQPLEETSNSYPLD